MKRYDEFPAGQDLHLLPEWTTKHAGQCATCYFAKRLVDRPAPRCSRHSMMVADDYSCSDYVPAPELREAALAWGIDLSAAVQGA
jgi:hypothetical protein